MRIHTHIHTQKKYLENLRGTLTTQLINNSTTISSMTKFPEKEKKMFFIFFYFYFFLSLLTFQMQ